MHKRQVKSVLLASLVIYNDLYVHCSNNIYTMFSFCLNFFESNGVQKKSNGLRSGQCGAHRPMRKILREITLPPSISDKTFRLYCLWF